MDISVAETRHHYRYLWLILGMVYLLMLVLGSLLKIPHHPANFQHNDKLVHFLAYFILAGWFMQLYRKQISRLFIVLGAVSLGLLLEFLQGEISYRSFDWIDALANTLGAVSALLLSGTPFSSMLRVVDHKIHQLFHQTDQGG